MGSVIANRYEVLGDLGSGGGGEVYRVRDHNEGDEVALKIIDPASLSPYGPWAEAQILRRLSEPSELHSIHVRETPSIFSRRCRTISLLMLSPYAATPLDPSYVLIL